MSGGMIMVGSGHLEECINWDIIHLVQNLESLDKVAPNSSVCKSSQTDFLEFFLIGSLEARDLSESPVLDILDSLDVLLQV